MVYWRPAEAAGSWLAAQAANPFACGTISALLSLATVVLVSWFTERPSEAHLNKVFGEGRAPAT
jgi:hypothetical protein